MDVYLSLLPDAGNNLLLCSSARGPPTDVTRMMGCVAENTCAARPRAEERTPEFLVQVSRNKGRQPLMLRPVKSLDRFLEGT